MSRSFALRLLETFFHRWWLCLLPAVLLVGLGAASVATAKSNYLSQGVMYVESQTLLSKLTGTDNNAANNAFLTPAQDANARLTSLIGTDEFINSIVDRAGLTDSVKAGLLTVIQIRRSIAVSSLSANTLRVSGSSLDPQVSYRLAQGTIDSFTQWVIDASITDSTTAEQFLNSLAQTYKTDLQVANDNLQKYLQAHPEPALVGSRPASETIAITGLTGEVTDANSRYTSTLSKAEDARLTSAQTRSNVAGRLRLVDAPKVPPASTSSRKKTIVRMGLFSILGLALSAVAVFVGTVTDKTFRSPEEIRQRLGVPLLAVVPESGPSTGPRGGRGHRG